jgi:hypothetical protein
MKHENEPDLIGIILFIMFFPISLLFIDWRR